MNPVLFGHAATMLVVDVDISFEIQTKSGYGGVALQ